MQDPVIQEPGIDNNGNIIYLHISIAHVEVKNVKQKTRFEKIANEFFLLKT